MSSAENPDQRIAVLQARVAELEAQLEERASAATEESSAPTAVPRGVLGALLEGAPLATCLWRREGEELVLESYSREAARFLGADHAAAEPRLGAPLAEVHERRPTMLEQVRRCFAEGRSLHVEMETECPVEGGTAWVVSHYLPLPPDRVAVYTMDVTGRRRAEERMHTSEARYRALFETASEGLALIDEEGRYVAINPAGCRIIGHSAEELVGRSSLELVVPDERSDSREKLHALFRDGSITAERRVRRADGEEILVELTATRLPGGGAVSLFRDVTEQRRLQSELLVKDAALSSASAGMALADPAGRLTYVNQAFVTLWGLSSAATALGRSVLDFWEDQDEVRTVVETVLSEGHWIGELVALRADGDSREVQVVASRVTGDSGEPLSMLASFIDVSERKRIERALQRTERRFRALAERVPAGIVHLDGQGRLTFANERARELAGEELPAGAVVGSFSHLHPDDREGFLEAWRRVLEEGGTMHREVRFVRPGGGLSWILAQLTTEVGDGERILGYIGIWTDVTDLKRAEVKHAESEARLENLLEAVPDAVVVTDAAGRLLFRNRAMPGLFQAAGGPGAESCVWDLIAEEDLGKLDRRVGRLMAGERLGPTEYRMRRSDGTWGPVEIYTVRSEYEGRPAMVSVVRDISERRRLEENLLQSRKMEAIGRLAGGIAHDFNNILFGIQGCSQVLAEERVGDEDAQEVLDQILAACRRGASLVEKLLLFGRGTASRASLVHLGEAATELQPMLARLIGEHIDLRLEIDPDAGAIEIDPGQLEQVVVNLVVNARDALPDGGSIRIAVRGEGPRSVGGSAWVVLEVSDDGCGMDEQTLSRAFEPFFTTKPYGQGTGLGLSTVFGVVEQLGGRMSVSSRPGEGSRFTVRLPRAEVRRQREPASGTPPARPAAGEVVLVAEDDPLIRTVVSRFLSGEGYEVLTASDGAEALEVLQSRQGRIDLLLADVVMPVIGGIELARRLESSPDAPAIIFMSGYSEDATDPDPPGGGRSRPGTLLRKPVAREDLLLAVRQSLDLRSRTPCPRPRAAAEDGGDDLGDGAGPPRDFCHGLR